MRGHGRCVQRVRANPGRFQKEILWACRHNITFDTQCEGPRAWFVYQLICCYEDQSPFLEAAVRALDRAKSDNSWKTLYLSELLFYFAQDGVPCAARALWRKYDALYAVLSARKRPPTAGSRFSARDDFAMLCEVLADSKEAILRIAEDIGRLYAKENIYDGWDFDWLFESKGKRYLPFLKRQAKKSENIARYLGVGQAYESTSAEAAQAPSEKSPQSGTPLSLYLRKTADSETVRRYVNEYLSRSAPEARAAVLSAFCRCPYPDNPAPILSDADASCEMLKEAAWKALANIRHPAARAFAISHLEKEAELALPVLIKNYEKQDALLLQRFLEKITVDFDCTTAWHGIQMDLLYMESRGKSLPKSILLYIYETTYCSCCRKEALVQMGKRRMLTTAILQECIWDSNDEIRAFARKRVT